MSLQLAIPRRVALQQSSLPLHQPSIILKEKKKIENAKSLNCKCANSKLSQQRGSPQKPVPFCAYEVSSERLEVVGSKLASPTGFEPVLPP